MCQKSTAHEQRRSRGESRKLRFGSNRTAPKIWQEGQHALHSPSQPIDWREHTIGAVHDRNLPTRSLQVPESYENFLWHRVTEGSKHHDWTASRWRSQSSSCQHHVITWHGLIPADHEYLDSVAWPCHDCEVAPVWHNDVTNARTCQFSAVCLTVFPFEFRPRTFTIGFYGKKSIISELMILECSFPLNFHIWGKTLAALAPPHTKPRPVDTPPAFVTTTSTRIVRRQTRKLTYPTPVFPQYGSHVRTCFPHYRRNIPHTPPNEE